MIIKTSIRFKRNCISYIPENDVKLLPDDANIISISDFDESRPEFKDTQRVLKLGGNLNPEDVIKAGEFVKSLNGENLYVHCREGLVRSRSLAMNIKYRFNTYRVYKGLINFVFNNYPNFKNY